MITWLTWMSRMEQHSQYPWRSVGIGSNTWLSGHSWFQLQRDQHSSNVLDASALLQPTMVYCNEESIQCWDVSMVMLQCRAYCWCFWEESVSPCVFYMCWCVRFMPTTPNSSLRSNYSDDQGWCNLNELFVQNSHILMYSYYMDGFFYHSGERELSHISVPLIHPT